MDRTYIDDNQLVARYLADQLPEHEREAFEAFYLEHPEVVAELETVARLKVGLAELQASAQLEQMSYSRAGMLRRVTALAASVLIVVVLALWFLQAPKAPVLAASLRSLTDVSGTLPTIAATHTLVRLRGAEHDLTIGITQPGQAVELRVLPEIAADSGRYRASILAVSANGQTKALGSVTGLTRNEEGLITVFLEPRRLGVGQYRLTIADNASKDIAAESSTFTIKIAAR
jgi:hypothetical protein